MAHLLVLLLVAVPLVKLVLALAWPGLLRRMEGKRAEHLLTSQFGEPWEDDDVSVVGERLLEGSPLKASFWVLRGPLRNAVALPHGRIFVWEGLLAEIAGDESLLAGALAHELGHLERDHYLDRVHWTAMASFVLGLLGGGLVQRGLQRQAAAIVTRGFARAQELEADDAAVRRMQLTGFDPAGLLRLLERLARPEGSGRALGGLLGTHPDPALRAQRLREQLGLPDEEPPQEPTTTGVVIPFPLERRR